MSRSGKNKSNQHADADWDLNSPGRQKGSEIRIALLLIVSLVGALGFVVYRKYEERTAAVARPEEFVEPAREELVSTPDPPVDSGSEMAVDLFGQFEPEPPESDSSGMSTGINTPPFSSAESAAPPVAQDEPQVLDWSAQPLADLNRTAPARSTEFIPEFVGNAATPTEQDVPTTAAAADDGAVLDLFGAQQAPEQDPQPAPQPTNPFEVAATPAASATTDGGDPFPVMVEPNVNELPPAETTTSRTEFVELPPRPSDDVRAMQQGPAIERPATAADPGGSDWPDEPGVIRVNSDDHPGEAAQQAAAFDDPFFSDGSPGSPTSIEESPAIQEPAVLDFDNPTPASPAVDWSSPPGTHEGSSLPTPASGPTTGLNTGFPPAGTDDPFAATTSSRNPATGFDDPVEVHTVRPGESYWSVSRRYYGAGRYFSALAAYNQARVTDRDRLQPGMKILVPAVDVLRQRFPALLGTSYAPTQSHERLPTGFYVSRDGQPVYRVGRNDTLSSIAEAHLGRASRWRQIYGLNRDRLQNADRLQPGLELRLPRDASQAELVSRPSTFRYP